MSCTFYLFVTTTNENVGDKCGWWKGLLSRIKWDDWSLKLKHKTTLADNKNYIKYFRKYWLQGHMQQQNALKCNNGRKFPVALKFYGNVFSAAVVENMPIRNKVT